MKHNFRGIFNWVGPADALKGSEIHASNLMPFMVNEFIEMEIEFQISNNLSNSFFTLTKKGQFCGQTFF